MSTKPLIPLETLERYEDVRPRVADGDIFLFRGQYLISKLFERATHTFYSHAALAAWWGDRLMILQAEAAGIQAIPMSVAIGSYPGRADWYQLKREDGSGFGERLAQVMREAKSDLGLAYGYLDLLRNLIRSALKVKLSDPCRPRAMFCSEFVERAFRVGGMSLTGKPDVTTFPKDVAASPRLRYMATVPHDPKIKEARDRDQVR